MPLNLQKEKRVVAISTIIILMDPPAWGNGVKGEKWKLEDKIDQLFAACSQILSPNRAPDAQYLLTVY